MSPKKSKRFQNEKRMNIENVKLTRPPLHSDLYPDLTEEKENIEVYSSDDSPEKLQYTHSPRAARKINSPSSVDSIQGIPGSPQLRKRRHLQNEVNNGQDFENSDVDMETDDFVSKISPSLNSNEHYIPQSVRFEKDTKGEILKRPSIQSQRTQCSTSTSGYFFLEKKVILFFILFIIIPLIFTFGRMFFPKHSDAPLQNDHFKSSMLVRSLKSKFEDQPSLTFRIINSALKNVLDFQPEAPAIILLLATNGSEKVCSEFALKLVDLLSVSEHSIKIYGNNYKQANSNRAKMDIEKAIKALKSHKLGSVLISDLDQIPGQAAMILHTYCDHENAPYKKAVFVMTVNYNQAINDYSNTKVWDKAANDHLLSVWTDIGVDQAIPLLARLTVSVAVVTARSS